MFRKAICTVAVLAAFTPWLPACNGGEGRYEQASVETVGHIKILRLIGTAEQMGRQYGELMANELAEGVDWLSGDPTFSMLVPVAKSMGFVEEAMEQSYPEILDECRGMVEAAEEQGVSEWDMDLCIGLAWGEVIVEHVSNGGPGCTQAAAAGPATPDGELVHGRNMDWSELAFLLEHPTIIVRQPEGKIPFAVVGFPGSVAPYSGMNAAGLSIASDEIDARSDIDRTGRSHQQMMYKILEECSSLQEAEEFLRSQDHMTAEAFLVSDGNTGEAAVFEMTANHLAVRRLGEEGVLGLTNHFVHPDMAALCKSEQESPGSDSWTRWERLQQLIGPGGPDSLYGSLDVEGMKSLLADNYNPRTGEHCPPDTFDGCATIGNSATIYSMVFVPGRGELYMADGGGLPVPRQPFLRFTMDELLRAP
ncbi:MAG: hypothetical protein D6806_10860 [Deltaproteobacteria bacterium]|nr:MAG: hypothetical protein D6806_10860 [Deltaproteobacteria bacterium]